MAHIWGARKKYFRNEHTVRAPCTSLCSIKHLQTAYIPQYDARADCYDPPHTVSGMP